ncbi:MAG TPA: FtsX-like permease family protein [Steroidobacteraceae bacterium]|jgi:putative ABC transport system permease protein|nr:FtsX-like permease family protein [Steroidobacteraceae bacterium]
MKLMTQLLAVSSISLRSLPSRAASSAVIVIGTAGVVAVLLSVLALATGLSGALSSTGSPDRAIVLHAQATNEVGSTLAHDSIATILDAPGIAQDAAHRAIGSAEALASVNLPRLDNGKLSSLILRGVSSAELLQLRPELHLVKGRMFESGLREIIVGKEASERYANLGLGGQPNFGGNQWTVVGIFDSGGGAHDSEVLGDADTALAAYQRTTYNSVIVKLAGPGALEKLRAALLHDPTLSVEVNLESAYYERQSQTFASFLTIIARSISTIMAIGAVFAALNTMYSAVSTRSVEIATLRAIGYGAGGVVVSVIVEALVLSLLGAVAGAGLAWAVFDGNTVSSLASNGGLAQIVFHLHIGAALFTLGIVWACVVGLIGGLLPAIRAARIPVALALRAI